MKMRRHRHGRAKMSRTYRAIAEMEARVGGVIEKTADALANAFMGAAAGWQQAYQAMARAMFSSMTADIVRSARLREAEG